MFYVFFEKFLKIFPFIIYNYTFNKYRIDVYYDLIFSDFIFFPTWRINCSSLICWAPFPFHWSAKQTYTNIGLFLTTLICLSFCPPSVPYCFNYCCFLYIMKSGRASLPILFFRNGFVNLESLLKDISETEYYISKQRLLKLWDVIKLVPQRRKLFFG